MLPIIPQNMPLQPERLAEMASLLGTISCIWFGSSHLRGLPVDSLSPFLSPSSAIRTPTFISFYSRFLHQLLHTAIPPTIIILILGGNDLDSPYLSPSNFMHMLFIHYSASRKLAFALTCFLSSLISVLTLSLPTTIILKLLILIYNYGKPSLTS